LKIDMTIIRKPILKNITFNVRPNTINVIYGKLDAGKTTLLNVMAGFYEATSGAIMFDKIPLKNLDKIALRDKIGFYTPDMVIIKGTLLDNILFGRTGISTEDNFSQFQKGISFFYIISIFDVPLCNSTGYWRIELLWTLVLVEGTHISF